MQSNLSRFVLTLVEEWKKILFGPLFLLMLMPLSVEAVGVQDLNDNGKLTTCSLNDFEGAGGQYDPYLISSYDDICELRDLVDSGSNMEGVYFRQTEDIVFPEEENWNPIGEIDVENNEIASFAGYYDGHGHTLSNIHCDNQYAGVFTFLSGEVRNLGVVNSVFRGSCVGGITSHGESCRIINCYTNVECVGTDRAGGISDNCAGTIMFCWSLGKEETLSDENAAVGISSYGDENIYRCYSVNKHLISKEPDVFWGNISASRTINTDDKAVLNAAIEDYYQSLWDIYSWQTDSNTASDDRTEKLLQEKGDDFYTGWYDDVEINRGSIAFMVLSDDGEIGFAADFSYQPEIFAQEKEKNKELFLAAYKARYDFVGSGTKEDPFQISSYEELCRMRDAVDYGVTYRGYYFVQISDIEVPDGEEWNPIGEMSPTVAGFSGIYDGMGHVISNIVCNDQYAGLFLYLDGTVMNLGIESGEFTGDTVGSITSHGSGNARVINCYNKAFVCGKSRAGGITDNFQGLVLYCVNLGAVEAEEYASGITSYGGATIKSCYTTENSIICTKTFTGIIDSSDGNIGDNDLPAIIREMYTGIHEYAANEELNYSDLVYMDTDGQSVVFKQNYVPTNVLKTIGREWISLILVTVVGIVLAVVTIFYVPKRKRKIVCTQCGNGIEWGETVRTPIEQDKRNKLSFVYSIKRSKKRILGGGLFAVSLTLFFTRVMLLMDIKYTAGMRDLDAYERDEENGLTDILFCGSSTTSVNVELAELWERYGIAGYCIGAGGMSYMDAYYRLVEAETYHHASMLIIDGASFRQSFQYAGYESQTENISGLEYSFNKAKYVTDAVQQDLWVDYFLRFPLYHNRYGSLDKWDFSAISPMGKYDKGTWTVFYGNQYEANLDCAQDTTEYYAIDEKQMFYFRKIVEFCENNDINLLLIKTPDANRKTSQRQYNAGEILAEEENVPFLNLNYYDDEISLTRSDFYYDGTHLNIKGARKTTDFLGEYLIENYDFVDHRGDSAYESWDFFSANRENMYMKQMSDPDDYFDELDRDASRKRYTLIPYGMTEEELNESDELAVHLLDLNCDILDGEDGFYGSSKNINLELGTSELEITKEYATCTVNLSGSEGGERIVTGKGCVLLVYDEVLQEVADVAFLTQLDDSSWKVSHLY